MPPRVPQLDSDLRSEAAIAIPTAGIAILIEDPVNRRLVESASVHLGLRPILLDGGALDLGSLPSLDLIVADRTVVRGLRSMLGSRESTGDNIHPAIIAVQSRQQQDEIASADLPATLDPADRGFDAVLPLPQAPAAVAAQLSLLLRSHRAFARRYHSALEELQLNRRIFRSVTSGISVANALEPDLPLTYVNPAFEVMTGYSLEEVLGRNCRFLQGEQNDQPALTLVREALRDQREVVAVLKNFRKDGTPFWNELSLSPIRNREGDLTHFVGIQNDVTARVEFEAALRESEKLAAVGRLASSIAHEINNPLESLMNLVYIAERSDSAEETKHYLSMMDKELQRVKLIASQSLRFYRQSTRPQAASCTELLDLVLDLHQARLGNSAISVERRERSTQSIICMESEIRQVLNNLLGNAIDAMHGKGGRLSIRTRESTEWRSGATGVYITVADTGTGMDAETRANMYKAFYTTKGIGGTGLGLWISSEIIARHRGRLIVRSSQRTGASGTVFELFLPFQGLST